MGRAGRIGAAWCAAAVVALAAGCTGAGAAAPSSPTVAGGTSSAGPVQSTAASSVITAASSAVTSTSTSPSTASSTTPPSSSAPTSSTPASSSPSTGWTAPDYGDAKSAVDAYLAIRVANDAGLMDPKHADTALLERHTAGQARDVMIGSIRDEVNHGTAWRGTPWQRRVLVEQQAPRAASFTLTDCPAPSASWAQYDVATGRTIPQPPRTPPPPYLATINIAKQQGVWVMVTIHVDGSKTCTR